MRIYRQKSQTECECLGKKSQTEWRVSCSGQKSQSELDFDKIGRVVEVKMGMASLTTCRKNRYPT